MSVLNKIKAISENAEKLAKEKPVVKITADCCMLIENYQYLRLYGKERIIIELDGFELDILGTELSIDFFSSSRIMLSGKIRTISYVPELCLPSEEL